MRRPDPAYLSLCVPLMVAGVGISMAMPTAPSAALNAVTPAQLGAASGVSNTMQRFGGAFGIAVVSTVFTAFGGFTGADAFIAGFRPAIVVAAILSAIGALVSLRVARRPAIAIAPAAATPAAEFAASSR